MSKFIEWFELRSLQESAVIFSVLTFSLVYVNSQLFVHLSVSHCLVYSIFRIMFTIAFSIPNHALVNKLVLMASFWLYFFQTWTLTLFLFCLFNRVVCFSIYRFFVFPTFCVSIPTHLRHNFFFDFVRAWIDY